MKPTSRKDPGKRAATDTEESTAEEAPAASTGAVARPAAQPHARPRRAGGTAAEGEAGAGSASVHTSRISSLESLADVISAEAEAGGSPAQGRTGAQGPTQAQAAAQGAVEGYTQVKSACLNCRKSRVKCDKMLPCARCRRLGQECKPQKRGRGRPPTSLKGPDESHLLVMESRVPRGGSMSGKEGGGGSKRKESGSSRQGKGAKRKSPDSRAKSKTQGKKQTTESSVRKDPSKHVYEVLLNTFNSLLEKRQIKPQSCASYTRYWAFVSAHLELEELKKLTLHLANCLGINVNDIYGKTVAKRDPLQAFQLIPQEYRLQHTWNTADVAYVEQTVIDGASSLACNDLFRKLFFDEHVPQSEYKDLLSRLIFEKDIEEFFQTFGEAIFTSDTGGGGTVVRHVLRFNVRFSASTMLGLIYHHSFVSPDGSIAHCASRIFPLPASKLFKLKHTIDQPNIIRLETKPPHTQPIPGQGPFDNVHGSAWLQSALAAAFRNTSLPYGLPMGMPISPQLSPSSPHGLFFPQQQQQQQSMSSSSSAAAHEGIGMGIINSVLQQQPTQQAVAPPSHQPRTMPTNLGAQRIQTAAVQGSQESSTEQTAKGEGSSSGVSAELSESERQKDLKQHKLRTA